MELLVEQLAHCSDGPRNPIRPRQKEIFKNLQNRLFGRLDRDAGAHRTEARSMAMVGANEEVVPSPSVLPEAALADRTDDKSTQQALRILDRMMDTRAAPLLARLHAELVIQIREALLRELPDVLSDDSQVRPFPNRLLLVGNRDALHLSFRVADCPRRSPSPLADELGIFQDASNLVVVPNRALGFGPLRNLEPGQLPSNCIY